MTDVKKGDRVRVRRLGSSDTWCYCTVEMVSPNGVALGLAVEDGALYSERGELVTGFLPISIIKDNAYEIGTMTKLEMEGTVQ